MIKINQKSKPSTAAVIVPMAAKIKQLYYSRLFTISKMEGYPVALHVIGRLQRQFKLDSYANLLFSIKKLRDIAKITADVIDSMEGVKVDRYQLNRTEIIAYINNVTASATTIELDDDDRDLIANLITSFEANPNSWILSGGVEKDNMHIAFKNLYKGILGETPGLDLAVYSPHNDEITTLGKLPQFTKAGKKKPKAETTTSTDNDAAVIYSLAATKIIDHVYHLLLDKDIWYAFVSPRAKAEVASNLERAKSLKTFALYLQNLLSYNQFFTLELFLKGYDLVQDWITNFPPLEATTTYNLESIVRPHDILDVKGDVDTLISSFTNAKNQNLASNLIVFPSELLASLGIRSNVENLIADASRYLVDTIPTDLSQLDQPLYIPVLSGAAAGTFDIAFQLTQTILIGKKVSGEIDLALAGLTPSLVRGASKVTIDNLRQFEIRAHLPFAIPHALEWSVTRGVEKGIDGNKIRFDSAAPSFSWDYHKFLRDKSTFKVISDEIIAKQYPYFSLPQAFDRDRASEYRSLLGYQWKSLVSAKHQNGTRVYTESYLRSGEEQVRGLIEAITGKSFEIVIREMEVPHLRAVYATYLSSFALLYVDDAAARPYSALRNDSKEKDLTFPTLIEGHGQPYGCSYTALDSKQGKITGPDAFITLKAGIYLRILKYIPVATDDLTFVPSFYNEHPTMYFSSNSTLEEVHEWVLDDGLLHLAMIPMMEMASVPRLFFTAKFTYLTMGVFLNMDTHYKPGTSDPAREVSTISIQTKEWPFDRNKYFLQLKTFGPYGSPANKIELSEEVELVADTVKKIEQRLTADNQEQSDSVNNAGSSMSQAAQAVATETAAHSANVDKSSGTDKAAFILPNKDNKKKGKENADGDIEA